MVHLRVRLITLLFEPNAPIIRDLYRGRNNVIQSIVIAFPR